MKCSGHKVNEETEEGEVNIINEGKLNFQFFKLNI